MKKRTTSCGRFSSPPQSCGLAPCPSIRRVAHSCGPGWLHTLPSRFCAPHGGQCGRFEPAGTALHTITNANANANTHETPHKHTNTPGLFGRLALDRGWTALCARIGGSDSTSWSRRVGWQLLLLRSHGSGRRCGASSLRTLQAALRSLATGRLPLAAPPAQVPSPPHPFPVFWPATSLSTAVLRARSDTYARIHTPAMHRSVAPCPHTLRLSSALRLTTGSVQLQP